ncbi:hypothetical protein [Phreatobacter sp.]|uniref:hypothetical protein n=1 Tax=Phreatobacter sp. TaxID=1966341 RepID=UPI003F6F83DF
MLEPIETDRLDEARLVLSRGFAARDGAFWHDGLRRLDDHHRRQGLGPCGYLMRRAGEAVGVILTMRSRREAPGQPGAMVNLSSWYIDEPHRWLAPRMLKLALDEEAVVTDLTPSPRVLQMMDHFGFEPWTEGAHIAALPLAAARAGRGFRIAADDRMLGDLSPGQAKIAEDHLALGCIVAGLAHEGRVSLLVFSPTRRKGIRSARLVYAEDRGDVAGAFGPIARFLLRRGILCAEFPGDATESLPGAWFTRRARPTFFRGAMRRSTIDHAYSEFVFLRI